ASEGSLTNMRAELVRASSLARWARQFALGEDLVVGRSELARGARDRDRLLASGFEAIVGALYLDQGLEAVRGFLSPLLGAAVRTVSPAGPRARDAKSELQYRAQARWGILPRYQVVSMEGPEHRPVFTIDVGVADEISARGTGPSKQGAEQDAARQALEQW